jgi:hypothetical protein
MTDQATRALKLLTAGLQGANDTVFNDRHPNWLFWVYASMDLLERFREGDQVTEQDREAAELLASVRYGPRPKYVGGTAAVYD